MNIHQANIADIKQLQQIGKGTYRHYFAELWQSQVELEAFLDNDFSLDVLKIGVADPQQHWWLASEDEQATGFAKVHYDQPLPDSALSGAMLCKLYLQPDAKSRGVGFRLFDHVEQQAKARQQDLLWLTVLQSNTAAIAFYRRQGMDIHSASAYVTATQTTALWVMKKALG